jgi:hypothetical protein
MKFEGKAYSEGPSVAASVVAIKSNLAIDVVEKAEQEFDLKLSTPMTSTFERE